MVTAIEPLLREQLIDRRQKLITATNAFHRPAELTRLMEEVDAALHRMDIPVADYQRAPDCRLSRPGLQRAFDR